MKMQFCNVHGHNGWGSHAKIILCIPPPQCVGFECCEGEDAYIWCIRHLLGFHGKFMWEAFLRQKRGCTKSSILNGKITAPGLYKITKVELGFRNWTCVLVSAASLRFLKGKREFFSSAGL